MGQGRRRRNDPNAARRRKCRVLVGAFIAVAPMAIGLQTASAVQYIVFQTVADPAENPYPHWITSSISHANSRIGGLVEWAYGSPLDWYVYGQTIKTSDGLSVGLHSGVGQLEWTDPVAVGYSQCSIRSTGELYPVTAKSTLTCHYTRK